jgi:hypothetical protein
VRVGHASRDGMVRLVYCREKMQGGGGGYFERFSRHSFAAS